MKATYISYTDGSDSVSIGTRDLSETTLSDAVVSVIRLFRKGSIPILIVLKGGIGMKKSVDWAVDNIDLLDEVEEDLKVTPIQNKTPPVETAGWEYEGVDFHS